MGKKLLITLLSIVLAATIVACDSADDSVTEDEIGNIETIDHLDNQEDELEEVEDARKFEEIDWEKAIEETKEELLDEEFFSYVKDVHIEVDDGDKKISFTAVLGDATDNETAVDFADTIIRRFSSHVSMQDNDIKGPGHEYLGEIFDYYTIAIGITPASKVDNAKEWYVHDFISSGRHRNPKSNK